MIDKMISLPVYLALIILTSCVSEPQKAQADKQVVESKPDVIIDEKFDPTTVSQTFFNSTKEEVRLFIEDLNQIIKDKDYDSWKKVLSSEYFADISSEENLRKISEQPAMTTRKIVLRTPEDYFMNVVVPSRDNYHVDDIEFIGRNKVKAFTLTINKAGDEQRIRLYDLEKINNMWTIIN